MHHARCRSHSALGTRHFSGGGMTWLTGRIERQLVTALLLLALLVSCGVAGRAQQAPLDTGEPTTVAEEPAPTEPVPAVPPTQTRAPSTSPLARYRLVTYYGHPAASRMGILGEFDDPEQMVAK